MFIYCLKQVDKQLAATLCKKLNLKFERGNLFYRRNFVNKKSNRSIFFFFFFLINMFFQLLFITGTSVSGLLLISIIFLVAGYLGYVRYHRYKFLNSIVNKYPDPNIVLQNHDIAMEIYSDIFRKEFPCKSYFLFFAE